MGKSQMNERALEAAIEKALTGSTSEAIKEQGIGVAEAGELYRGGNGYYIGDANDYNAKYAIDETRFWHFLQATQEEELEKLQRHADWKLKILERFDRMVKQYGILHLLRKGLAVENAHFTLLYDLPMVSSSQRVKENFEKNEFSVTRQVRYSLSNPREEVDMVIFINGLAIATFELKNPWTGQTARVHGIRQYKEDRDTQQTLFNFGRAVVHFAVDTDEAYMCTKLVGNKSFFLPFNKGNNNGKGNPVNPNGHRTAYLWEEVLTRESLTNILQHFVRLDGKMKDPLKKRTLFFPRYHQMDVVRKLLKDVSENGVGKTYLIQHSAGSGKSNSITWLAYQLIECYPEREGLQGSKGMDLPLFDSVIVVTDRRLLDQQIRDNIKDFSQVKNIVAPAYSSRDLRKSLEEGKKIIITTIQKFPFIVDEIDDLSDNRFAVVIDEAHSSQSGIAADTMNQVMGMDDAEEDAQDKILRAMKARKMRNNASYFAFTATPKNTTLERFGVQQEDGSFKEFHLYSMKQAIEEGFILDVLSNYTTYKSYYEIIKSVEDNPEFDTAKAQKKLKAYVERDKRTISVKAEIMVDHFMDNVYNTKKLKGKAKAMVLTQSIESAIRYYLAINRILADKGNPFKIAIAFSGDKTVDGIEYTEAGMNGFPQNDTAEMFDTDDYRILVVADKYLTGFDQPKLCTMYVDKKLQNVLAVQALSRLNRSANNLGKKTEDIFVLDFFNEVDDIKRAFDPFYTSTRLSEATDVNVLHELKDSLDYAGVYEWSEVEEFVEKFFDGVDAQEISSIIETSAERFNSELQLEDEEKVDYKVKAKQFVKIYGQMAAILPYEMVEWEKLFWFLKFLIPKLIVKEKTDVIDDILESVDLSTYGLARKALNQKILLDEAETEVDPQNPNPRGAHGGGEEKDPLDEIIRTFNERWFEDWGKTPEEQKIKIISIQKQIMKHPDYQSKYADNLDVQNRELALNKIVDEVIRKQYRGDVEFYKMYRTDNAFHTSFIDMIKRMVDGVRI